MAINCIQIRDFAQESPLQVISPFLTGSPQNPTVIDDTEPASPGSADNPIPIDFNFADCRPCSPTFYSNPVYLPGQCVIPNLPTKIYPSTDQQLRLLDLEDFPRPLLSWLPQLMSSFGVRGPADISDIITFIQYLRSSCVINRFVPVCVPRVSRSAFLVFLSQTSRWHVFT